jgi:predicted phosphodiesterase
MLKPNAESATIAAMPRRVAVLSDVHSNLPALRAVLADADALGAEELVVAGDVIGFGPEPVAVLDLLCERGARMIRGNHEKDYVAVYRSPAMPAGWATSPRLTSARFLMDRLGAERRAYLAALPDRLMLDELTLVIHGSPRNVRDSVLAWTPDAELEAMYAGDPSRLVCMGHTHRFHRRDLPTRRLVNVGAIGLPLDGDVRASYVIVDEGDAPGEWAVTHRRIPYDVEEHLAGFTRCGLAEVDPLYVEIMRRQLRRAVDYYGGWFRYSANIPDDEVDAAMRRYLAANP